MGKPPTITIEFYGTARHRVGRTSVSVAAGNVAEAITQSCGALMNDGTLSTMFLASLNAGPFLTRFDIPLTDGDRILILSADAGG